jgi:hypothetical protein
MTAGLAVACGLWAALQLGLPFSGQATPEAAICWHYNSNNDGLPIHANACLLLLGGWRAILWVQ